MTGYLNPHGTPLGLNGQFISLSDMDDEMVGAFEHPDLMVFPDDEERIQHEIDMREGIGEYDHLDDGFAVPIMMGFQPYVDPQLEETFWGSLLLGADYDWEVPEDDVATWIAERYAEVIQLNDKYGFQARPIADNDDELHPLEHTPRPFDSDFRGYNLNRGKEHRLPGGWKRYAGAKSPRWSLRHTQMSMSDWYHLGLTG